MMAATIANLRRTWNWREAQEAGDAGPSPIGAANVLRSVVQRLATGLKRPYGRALLGRIGQRFRLTTAFAGIMNRARTRRPNRHSIALELPCFRPCS